MRYYNCDDKIIQDIFKWDKIQYKWIHGKDLDMGVSERRHNRRVNYG